MGFFVSYFNRICQSLLLGGFLKLSPLNTIIKVFFKLELYSYIRIKSRDFCKKKYDKESWEIYRYIEIAIKLFSVYLEIIKMRKIVADAYRNYYSKNTAHRAVSKENFLILISIKSTKPSKTQRHLVIFYSPYSIVKHHGVCVSLRLLLNIFLNKTINPMAQAKKTSFVVKENLNLNSNYVFTGFVPSGLFYIYIDICTKKVTGPKRIKSNVSPLCCQPFFLFTFGAFFLAAYKSLPIKSRRGAGAIFRHLTSFCYYGCLTFVTKKRNAIASCTFAVFFFFLFFAIYVCLIQTQKNSKWREYVSI